MVEEDISMCKSCLCMTKTVEGKCEKCGGRKYRLVGSRGFCLLMRR